MCEQVIEWGKQGKSRVWMAAHLDITHETLLQWAKEKPDFSEALTRANVLSQAHWEDLGHQCMVMNQGQTFSQSAWSRSMAARFPDHWREKAEVKHDATDNFAGLLGSLTGNVFPKADGEDKE